jgi:alpha-L-fucosidase 2
VLGHKYAMAICSSFLLLLPSAMAQPSSAALLWYGQPADKWIQALPIGNGRLGAMVFGQPSHDRMQLNDVTIWSGAPQPDADLKDAYKSLPELRSLLAAGHYDEAGKFANAHFNSPAPYTSSYQTLGDLNFDFVLPNAKIESYHRELDLSDAISRVRFQSGRTNYRRETFSSAPQQAIVERLSADRPGAITFALRLSRLERTVTRVEGSDTLVMTGDTGGPLKFEVRVRVILHGGVLSSKQDGSLMIQGSNDVLVVVTSASNFKLDYATGYVGGDLSAAQLNMQVASTLTYDELRARHIADYKRFYNRVKLDLGPTTSMAATDERLKTYGSRRDSTMMTLLYNYGRYLLISSSRPDNPLPSNSQGIWGDGLNLPWKADYKSNINYEMNYWASEPANLSEMHLPMLRMTQNLVTPGTKTAKAYYGPDTPGWVVGYTTNGWSWTSPGERLPWGIWFGGSAWMCQHLWDHYAFTRDKTYLASVYPTLKGAAEFWLANMVRDKDGMLIVSPSSSPENSFKTDEGVVSTIDAGATMERELVWDLLTNVVEASKVLGRESEFRQRASEARDHIRPLQVGRNGQLMEWSGDWDDPTSHHRHVSHLFALHPGHQITPDETPALAIAAEETLRERGDEANGWALTWRANLWARLHKGDRALDLLSNQMTFTEETRTVMEQGGGLYPDLFDAHPPFQIDGNFGAVSAIDEMLLQSQQTYVDPQAPNEDHYYLDLLPALPTQWSKGRVTGLHARGGFEVDETWQDGHLVRAILSSKTGGDTIVRYNHEQVPLHLEPGGRHIYSATLN